MHTRLIAALLALVTMAIPAFGQGVVQPPRYATRPAGDNSTYAATTGYVDRSAQTLINSLAGKQPLSDILTNLVNTKDVSGMNVTLPGSGQPALSDALGAVSVVRSTVSTRKIPYPAMRLVGQLTAGDAGAGALYVRQSIINTGLNPVTDAAGTVFNYAPDAKGLSLLAMGCVDDGASSTPTDNYASCILPAVNYLDAKGGGNLLIDGFFATSQAVPERSYVRYLPAQPGISGFIAHPTSTDNVLGEATPPSNKLPIVNPYFGAGLVIDGNSANVAYNTRGPGGVTDDAYQNCVRLYQVQGLEAPSLTVRNCVFNGYSDYFYGSGNHVGKLIARNIGKSTNVPAGGAKSYNAAWIEFDTTRSTLDFLDVDGARGSGYYLTTGYASAYSDATQFYPSVLGGSIRNTQGDGMRAEIVGGDYGELRGLRWLDVDIDMTGAPAGVEGWSIRSPSTSGNNVVSSPTVRVTVRGASQHGGIAYGNVTTPRFSGSSKDNGGSGLVLGSGLTDAVVESFVALGNTSGNLVDQGTRTRIGLGVVIDQATAQLVSRAINITTSQYPQLQLEASGNVGLTLLRDGVIGWTFVVNSDKSLSLYAGGNQVQQWVAP